MECSEAAIPSPAHMKSHSPWTLSYSTVTVKSPSHSRNTYIPLCDDVSHPCACCTAVKQLKVDVRSESGAYVGSLSVEEWDLVRPLPMHVFDFEDCRSRLGGFCENARSYPLSAITSGVKDDGGTSEVERLVQQRVQRALFVCAVQGLNKRELMFAGCIHKGSEVHRLLITISLRYGRVHCVSQSPSRISQFIVLFVAILQKSASTARTQCSAADSAMCLSSCCHDATHRRECFLSCVYHHHRIANHLLNVAMRSSFHPVADIAVVVDKLLPRSPDLHSESTHYVSEVKSERTQLSCANLPHADLQCLELPVTYPPFYMVRIGSDAFAIGGYLDVAGKEGAVMAYGSPLLLTYSWMRNWKLCSTHLHGTRLHHGLERFS